MKPSVFFFAVILLSLSLMTGCGSKTEVRPAAAPAAVSTVLESVFVSAAPEGEAQAIPAARTVVKPGEDIILEGKIMGVMEPFVEGRAVFVLGDDATLSSCDENPDDGCVTPWDVCCDPEEVVQAGIATIQVVDADGAVLKEDIKGVNGLKELSKVRITGTVAENSTAAAMIVNAREIYMQP